MRRIDCQNLRDNGYRLTGNRLRCPKVDIELVIRDSEGLAILEPQMAGGNGSALGDLFMSDPYETGLKVADLKALFS